MIIKNVINDAIKVLKDTINPQEEIKDEYLDIKNQIIEEIEKHDSIVIVRHVRPDGDCIGSSFGLREILKQTYPNKKIYSVGDGVVEYLKFLGEEDIIDDEVYKESLVIVVDTATSKRVASPNYTMGKKIIKIDHHIAVESYGDINYVREDYPACCQIIADLAISSDKLIMNEKAAKCLYTGLVTDTGRFRFRSVNSKTFDVASNILKLDIDTESIYTNLNVKSAESYKLQGYMYQNFSLTENGVAYAFITKKIMKKFKASVEDASNLVNCLDSIKGSMIWILFVEYDNEIRVRIRSRYLPVVEIGEMFNGGGHANACGASVKNKKEIKELLSVADKKLKAFKENNKELF